MKNIQEAADKINRAKLEIMKGIIGQEEMIVSLLLALLSNGHVLIEGLPGLAKTRAVNLLSGICGGQFRRIQFTPDLLPADIVGTKIYNSANAGFETKYGPIFGNFILADEINRSPAKVQSALLEAMQERQITIGEESRRLPEPFLVFATQNPIEQEGTYTLPEAQLDRFIMKLVVTHPSPGEEELILKMILEEKKFPIPMVVLQPDDILKAQELAATVHIEDKLVTYITQLVISSRNPEKYGLGDFKQYISHGASPRASIALGLVGRAKALLEGRDYVTAEDIRKIAKSVLRHRIGMNYLAEAEGINSEKFIDKALATIRAPA